VKPIVGKFKKRLIQLVSLKIDFIIGPQNKIINLPFPPIGSDLRLVEKTTQRFWVMKQPNKALDKNLNSQAASAMIICMNAVVAKIMKVRPQDPSCMT
jgi:hypothetical protein